MRLSRRQLGIRAAISVQAPGIETPVASAPIVASTSEKQARGATRDDADRREVSASGVGSCLVVTTADVDASIRVAAKTAIDAGDYSRVRALLELLDAKRTEVPALPESTIKVGQATNPSRLRLAVALALCARVDT